MSRLDRILAEADAPEPSPGFASAVMSAVRASERAPAPLPFPWGWLGTGLAAVLLAAVAAAVRRDDLIESLPRLEAPVLLALAVLAVSGLFSYLTVDWVRD